MVPDLYSRIDNTEKGVDAKAAWLAYDTTSDQQVTRDLTAAIDYLQGPPVENEPQKRRIGIVGHDMGGIYAMMMAGADLRVTCAVNYYGRILYAKTSPQRPASPVESLFNLRAPLLNFYGSIDPQIPATHLTTLESRLSRNLNKTFYEIIKYPNVGHSFMNPTREGYNKDAAEKTHEKTKTFLAQHLRAAPPATE
jgi:dienelactone hydrolase